MTEPDQWPALAREDLVSVVQLIRKAQREAWLAGRDAAANVFKCPPLHRDDQLLVKEAAAMIRDVPLPKGLEP